MESHTFPCEAVSLTVLLASSTVFSFCFVIGSKNSVSEEPLVLLQKSVEEAEVERDDGQEIDFEELLSDDEDMWIHLYSALI